MSNYRNTCSNCGDAYETESWEPAKCPFCELHETRATLKLAYAVLVKLEAEGVNDAEYAAAIIKIEEALNLPPK